MPILADFHVHIYPHYDLELALRAARENLSAHGIPGATKALVLTERNDCNFFEQASSGKFSRAGLSIARCSGDPNALCAEAGGEQVYIIAGRQVVSKERLELLSLFSDYRFEDRAHSFDEIFNTVKGEGGVLAINWAPGKWWGARGKLIARIIQDGNYRPLMLCDTTLRPKGYLLPVLQKRGAELGLPRIAGSDPLPIEGEEKRIGSYATLVEGDLDPRTPAASLKPLVLNPQIRKEWIGSRSSLPVLGLRLGRYYSARR